MLLFHFLFQYFCFSQFEFLSAEDYPMATNITPILNGLKKKGVLEAKTGFATHFLHHEYLKILTTDW